MKKVYESSTALESHMVKNLLENENIDSYIEGEYLQGGVGDLQAIGAIRVVVDEIDYIKAQKIISAWEAIQPEPEPEIMIPAKKSGTATGFILGVAVTVSLIYWLFGSPVTENGVDYNADGILDEVWIYKNGRLQQTLVDRNLDGKDDLINNYNNRSLLISSKVDENFDGIFETTIHFQNGNAITAEADTNNNGIIDHRTKYKNGVIDTVELINEASGKVKKRQYYSLNKLVADDYDTNADGILDSHYEYDQYEEKK